MNYIDVILGIILAWGAIQGFRKGLFSSIASLLAIVVGIYGGIHFSHTTAAFLKSYVDWSNSALQLVAFIITFIVVILLVTLSGKLLTKIADFAALGILNTLLGTAFGILKMGFIASVVLMLINAAHHIIPLIPKETLHTSILYSPVQKIAPMVLPTLLKNEE